MSTANYNLGLGILKTLYGHMKTTQSFDNFLKGLQLTWYGEVIPEADFKSWVSGIQDKKNLFLQIAWKTSSDYNDILKKIASKVPAGKLPDRTMIDSAFLNPDNFKASFVDIAKMTVKQTASGVSSVSKATVGALDFLSTYKGPLVILLGGIVALKLLKQSDKISAGYRRIRDDAASGYKKLSSDYKARKK